MSIGGALSVGSIAARLTVDNQQWSQGFQTARQDMRAFNQDVQQAGRDWQRIGQDMQRFGTRMSVGVTTPLLAAGAGMLKAAGDAEAASTRMSVTFGDAFDDINGYLVELQEIAPAAMSDLQNSASDAMGALVTLGVEQGRANEMTKEALKVTANLSAHMDRDFSETLAAVQAGYAGNTQALRDMAYNITQATIDSKALELGLIAEGEAAMGAERAIAVHNLVLEQSESIMDAAARQSGTFNFELRELWATVQDTGAAFGEILLPYATRFVEAAGTVIDAVGNMDSGMQALVLGIGGAAAAIGPLAVAAGTLMTVLAPISGTMLAVGAAAGVAAAGGVLIYQNWDTISERYPTLAGALERIIELFQLIGSTALEIFPHVAATAVTAADVIIGVWDTIASIIQTQVDNLILTVQGGADAIGNLLDGDLRGAYESLDAAGSQINDNTRTMLGDIEDGWERAKSAPETYRSTLELVQGAIGDLGDAFGGLASDGEQAFSSLTSYGEQALSPGKFWEMQAAADDAAEGITNLARQYEFLHGTVDRAAGRMSHWEGMASDAEQAAEILRDEIERTGDPTGELADKLEDVEWWIRRTEGGVHDLGLEFADSQVDLAEYHRLHDELRGALEDGEISQRDYEQAVRELNEQFGQTDVDPLTSALDEAGDLVDDMIGGIRDLLIELGVLDESDPEVKAHLDVNEFEEDLERLLGETDAERVLEMAAELNEGDFYQELRELVGDDDAREVVKIVAELDSDEAYAELEERFGTEAAEQIIALQTELDAVEVYEELDRLAGPYPDPVTLSAEVDPGTSESDIQAFKDDLGSIAPVTSTLLSVDPGTSHEDIQFFEDNITNLPTEHTTVAGFDTSDPDEKIPPLMAALGGIPGETNTTAYAHTTQAETDIGLLRGEIESVPSSFTITPVVDLLPATAALGILDDLMPHSPAKRGPLSREPNWQWLFDGLPPAAIASGLAATEGLARLLPRSPAETGPLAFTPDWDWLFQGLSAAADQYGEEAVAHARDYANAVQAAYGAAEAQISFAGVAGDFQAGGGTLPDDAFVTELKRRSEHMVESMGDSAATMSGEYLEHTNTYAGAVRSSWGALESALGFANAYSEAIEQENFGLPSDEFITDLKFSSEHAARSLGDSAAVLDMAKVEGADALGQALTGIWGGLSANVAFAREYADAVQEENFGLPSDQFVSDLKFQSEHAARSLADSAALLDPDGVAAADQLGQSLGNIWGGLGANLQFARDHSQAIQDDNFGLPDRTFIDDLIRQAEQTADMMIEAARELEDHEVASALGESLSSIFGGLGEVVRFVVATQDMSRRQGMIVAEDAFVDMLREIIEAYSRALQRVEAELGTEVLESNQRIAEMLAPVVDLIPGLATAFESIEEMSELSDDKISTFEGNIESVMESINRLTQMAAGGVTDSHLFVAQMQAIMAALEQAAAIMDGGSGSGSGTSGGSVSAGGGTFTQVPVMDDGGVTTRPTLALLSATARAQPEIASPVPLMQDTVRDVVRSELQRVAHNGGGVGDVYVYIGNEQIDARIERHNARAMRRRSA